MPVVSSTTPAGATGPRTRPAAQRRRDLLDAGLAVFRERGVPAATIEHITRAAGIAKGSFYLHFATKEHLLAALQADFETQLVARLDAAVAAAGADPRRRLSAWCDAVLAHQPADDALHDVLFHHVAHAEQRPEPVDRDMTDSLAAVLQDGVDAGVFTIDDVAVTALLLCGALHTLFDRVWHRDAPMAPERVRAATVALFGRAVVATG